MRLGAVLVRRRGRFFRVPQNTPSRTMRWP